MLNMVALWWLASGTETAEVLAVQLADLVWPGLSATSTGP